MTGIEDSDRSPTALLLIDVINDLEFPGNESIVDELPALARQLQELKRAARAAAIPVIYLNDNFNKWRSDFRELLEYCTSNEVKGRPLAEALRPDGDDYFVLKPMHSGFFGTPLDILLRKLGVHRLILTGIATDICVLYTANDAYMRDFELVVISDGVAANSPEISKRALNQMENLLKAKIMTVSELSSALARHSGQVTA